MSCFLTAFKKIVNNSYICAWWYLKFGLCYNKQDKNYSVDGNPAL